MPINCASRNALFVHMSIVSGWISLYLYKCNYNGKIRFSHFTIQRKYIFLLFSLATLRMIINFLRMFTLALIVQLFQKVLTLIFVFSLQQLKIGCGLINIGNSCFFNATLQALFHTRILADCFKKTSTKKCNFRCLYSTK